MKKIVKDNGSVFCNEGAWDALHNGLERLNPSKIFLLTDTNTNKHCLPYFLDNYSFPKEVEILKISAGEEHKNIESCNQLWTTLSTKGADRKSLLINLGGGVVTDLGGFVASTFQRGIQFINIPTSLLAMVDASVGGKNGVDLGVLKNQIGIIRNPHLVLVDTSFLSTLPSEEFTSGTAEMIKHGFITSETYLNAVIKMNKQNANEVARLIWESIEIKNNVITEDPTEQGLRKTLNFGHTLGHAIESYFLQNKNKKTLLHGEAIAIGMILACYISSEMLDFPKDVLTKTSKYLINTFGKESFSDEDITEIIQLLIYDKKNSNGNILFVLLENIGKHQLNQIVSNDLIFNAFNFYQTCKS